MGKLMKHFSQASLVSNADSRQLLGVGFEAFTHDRNRKQIYIYEILRKEAKIYKV